MRGFIVGTILTAIAFAIVTYLMPQITFDGEITTLLVIAVIFGVVNGLIGPFVRLLSMPLTLMTLGLFGFVINAGLLLLTAWLAGQFEIPFTISGFPPDLSIEAFIVALVAAAILGIVNSIGQRLVPGA